MPQLFFVPEGAEIHIDGSTSIKIKKINDDNTADIYVTADWANNAGSISLAENSPIVISGDGNQVLQIMAPSVMKTVFSAINLEIESGYGNNVEIVADQPVYLKGSSIVTISHDAVSGDKITIYKPDGETIVHDQTDADDQVVTITADALDAEGIWTATLNSPTRGGANSIFFRVDEPMGSAYSHVLDLSFRPLVSVDNGLLAILQNAVSLESTSIAIMSSFDEWDFAFIESAQSGNNAVVKIKCVADPSTATKMAALLSANVLSNAPDVGYPIGFTLTEAVSENVTESKTWTVSQLCGILKSGLKTRIDRGALPTTAGARWKNMLATVLPLADISSFALLTGSSSKTDAINAMRLAENSATSEYDADSPPPAMQGEITDVDLPLMDKVKQLYTDHKKEFQIAAAIIIILIIIKLKRGKNQPSVTIIEQASSAAQAPKK